MVPVMPNSDAGAGRRPATMYERIALRLEAPRLVVILVFAGVLGAPPLPYLLPGREDRLFTSVFNPRMGQIRGLPDVLYQGLSFALLVFSPLASIAMLERVWRSPEIGRERAWLRDRLGALVPVSRLQPESAHEGALEDIQRTVAPGIAERHVAAIRTWPFDTSILVRLVSSVALPLVLTLIGRQLVLAVLGL